MELLIILATAGFHIIGQNDIFCWGVLIFSNVVFGAVGVFMAAAWSSEAGPLYVADKWWKGRGKAVGSGEVSLTERK